MLNVTGQYVVSIVIALSQYVVPYNPAQIQEFSIRSDITQMEKEAYAFEPKSLQELQQMAEDEEAFARYLRAACLRVVSSAQTEDSVGQGDLAMLSMDLLLLMLLPDDLLKIRQSSMIPNENIDLIQARELGSIVCDSFRPIEDLIDIQPTQALPYLQNIVGELPRFQALSDLPHYKEISYVFDSSNAFLGELVQHEVNARGEIVQRNRRRVSSATIPLVMKQALVAVEDKNFWNFKEKGEGYRGHLGVDMHAMLRAVENFGSSGSGESQVTNLQGASTITQQLAKNLLLSDDVFHELSLGKRSLERKLKELLLARRLESTLSKDEILDLYLNTIDFGRNSQGVELAAESYFGKSLQNLHLEEYAFLAALPKAPNSLDPWGKNYSWGKERRDLVLNQMAARGFISEDEATRTKRLPISAIPVVKTSIDGYLAHYLSAVQYELRDQTRKTLGGQGDGVNVRVSVDHQMQRWAVESLQRGLLAFERKYGLFSIKPEEDQLPNISEDVISLTATGKNRNAAVAEVLQILNRPQGDMDQFELAAYMGSSELILASGESVFLSDKDKGVYKKVQGRSKSLDVGDVVYLQKLNSDYLLVSTTEVQGGLVVVENATGRILATAGRFSMGPYNRYLGAGGNLAFSGQRQPGSTVKPFSYLLALSKGIQPEEVLSNDSLDLPSPTDTYCNVWHVGGSSNEEGRLSLRDGLARSRNRVTVRTFMQAVGVQEHYDLRFYDITLTKGLHELYSLMNRYGLYNAETAKLCYPLILGTYETNLRDLTGAFSGLAVGHPQNVRLIEGFTENDANLSGLDQSTSIQNAVLGVLNSQNFSDSQGFVHHSMVSMLQSVLEKDGTGDRLQKWAHLIGGKTGTTDGPRDAWFVGFNRDITVGVWVGYKGARRILEGGRKSQGKTVALPIFEDFMQTYYDHFPEKLQMNLTEGNYLRVKLGQ